MKVGVVVIGRNEGARLERCLTSLAGRADRLVYVDSGSTDGSVAFARRIGAQVVALDAAAPFTAARGRNAGFEALRAGGLPDAVQFVDGDCAVAPGWIAAGAQALAADPGLGVVTGWRTEIAPAANAFHAMAEVEWHRPAGEIAACGGDMMVRATAWEGVGGMNPALIVSEDEDVVIRIRKAGWRALRLPLVMTRHDIAMTGLRAWWKRAERAGYGFAQVGGMHPPHFRAERRRALLYGLVLPVILVLGAVAGLWWAAVLALAAYGLSGFRVWRHLRREGADARHAPTVAALFTLAKLPQMQGMARYWLRRLRGSAPRLIEYK